MTTTTTVTATYLDPSETPCKGRVTFRLVAATYHDGLNAIFPTVPVVGVLNASGALSVELEPTSGASADFDSDTMTYEVRERINGTDRDAYYVDIPTATSVDLGTLVTYDDPPSVRRLTTTVDLTDIGYATTEDVAAISVAYASLDQLPTLEELVDGRLLSASISATTTVRIGPAIIDQRVGGLSLAFSGAVAASDTDYWSVALKRYRGASVVTLATKTTKTTGGEAITADTGWSFDAVSWLEVLRRVRAADVLAVTFTKTGSPSALTDVTASFRYEPNVLATVVDTFTRADSATSMGNTETSGVAWSILRATWGISSHQAYCAVAGATRNHAVIDTGSPDVEISARITAGMSAAGLTVRAQDADNYLTITASTLYRVVANGLTSLATWSSAVDGDTLTLKTSGNTVTVYVNGVQVAQVTEATYNTNTKHGLRASASTVPRFDDFQAVT